MYLHGTFLFQMLFILSVSVSVFHYNTNNTKLFPYEFSNVKNIMKEALVVDCRCDCLCAVFFNVLPCLFGFRVGHFKFVPQSDSVRFDSKLTVGVNVSVNVNGCLSVLTLDRLTCTPHSIVAK